MRTKLFLVAAALLGGHLLLSARRGAPVDAGTALRLDLPQLVARADLVLEARVTAERSLEGPRGLIETEYRLAVDRTFWGAEIPERSVRIPGGVLEDGRGLLLPGLPRLSVGEDVLLFLSAPGSTGLRVPVGLAQGKYRVVTDAHGRRSLVQEGEQLTLANLSTGGVVESGVRSRRDYAEAVAEIHAAVAQRLAGTLKEREDQ